MTKYVFGKVDVCRWHGFTALRYIQDRSMCVLKGQNKMCTCKGYLGARVCMCARIQAHIRMFIPLRPLRCPRVPSGLAE